MARFFRRGITKVRWLPAVASATLVPIRSEIDAGVDLTPNLADISGWQLSNSPIAVPNMADTFTSQIQGEDTVADSSMTFYDDDSVSTIRTTLAKGSAGFVMIMPYGDVGTKRSQVYKVTTTGVNDEFSVGNEAARFMVGFAVTATPNLNATIPAAV